MKKLIEKLREWKTKRFQKKIAKEKKRLIDDDRGTCPPMFAIMVSWAVVFSVIIVVVALELSGII